MIILAIKTDSPEAEFAIYNQDKLIDSLSFSAHRELADKIHLKINELLQKNKTELKDLNGVIVYMGPGSFTGLRIGLSAANALAYSLNIPITGAAHEDWPTVALDKIISGKNDTQVMPFYGAEPNITTPRK
jgi:tRNA threonylcarbamoyladenosine biosynthesis protein TsaB